MAVRWVPLLAASWLAHAATAQPVSLAPLGLYDARTILTGTDLRSRPTGLRTCLADVLTKVSGDPALLRDPRVARIDPAPLVHDFDYLDRMSGIPHHDEEGSSDRPFYFTVRFDPVRITAALKDLGEAPWPGPRPAIAPDVSITGPNGATFPLTADTLQARDMRTAFRESGERYGMVVGFPPDASGTSAIALRGTLTWSDADPGWMAAWQETDGGTVRRWGIRGVSFDAAFRDGVRGAMGIAAGHPPP